MWAKPNMIEITTSTHMPLAKSSHMVTFSCKGSWEMQSMSLAKNKKHADEWLAKLCPKTPSMIFEVITDSFFTIYNI